MGLGIVWDLFLLCVGFVSGVGFACFVMADRIWFRPRDRTLREMLALDDEREEWRG